MGLLDLPQPALVRIASCAGPPWAGRLRLACKKLLAVHDAGVRTLALRGGARGARGAGGGALGLASAAHLAALPGRFPGITHFSAERRAPGPKPWWPGEARDEPALDVSAAVAAGCLPPGAWARLTALTLSAAPPGTPPAALERAVCRACPALRALRFTAARSPATGVYPAAPGAPGLQALAAACAGRLRELEVGGEVAPGEEGAAADALGALLAGGLTRLAWRIGYAAALPPAEAEPRFPYGAPEEEMSAYRAAAAAWSATRPERGCLVDFVEAVAAGGAQLPSLTTLELEWDTDSYSREPPVRLSTLASAFPNLEELHITAISLDIGQPAAAGDRAAAALPAAAAAAADPPAGGAGAAAGQPAAGASAGAASAAPVARALRALYLHKQSDIKPARPWAVGGLARAAPVLKLLQLPWQDPAEGEEGASCMLAYSPPAAAPAPAAGRPPGAAQLDAARGHAALRRVVLYEWKRESVVDDYAEGGGTRWIPRLNAESSMAALAHLPGVTDLTARGRGDRRRRRAPHARLGASWGCLTRLTLDLGFHEDPVWSMVSFGVHGRIESEAVTAQHVLAMLSGLPVSDHLEFLRVEHAGTPAAALPPRGAALTASALASMARLREFEVSFARGAFGAARDEVLEEIAALLPVHAAGGGRGGGRGGRGAPPAAAAGALRAVRVGVPADALERGGVTWACCARLMAERPLLEITPVVVEELIHDGY
ncbi:MAG: hypothetical protein J3K34DRAFT_495929 [Monoraphidium minutum]|nr:MAG: hypothetical protein J3K34DRAFT_495929 [Monoraphidium minutum]